jgi:outer membrane protein assembly factor BamB
MTFVSSLYLGCGKPVNLTASSWESKAGLQVLRLRWVKKLAPKVPNFLIPEMVEEHDRFEPIETSSAGFDTDKKRAFIGAAVGGLYCVDIRSGDTVWRFNVNDPVGSHPLYDSDRKYVFFGADNGKFYAIHARSGRKIWVLDTGAEIRKRAILHKGTLYIATADNTVFALDPDNGEVVWQYRRPPLKGFSSAGYAGMVLEKNKLITGFSDGYLVALDPVIGNALWSRDLASEVSVDNKEGVVKLTDSDATPVIVGDVLVAASVDGGVQGLAVDSGRVVWTMPDIIGVTGLAQSHGVVYAARSGHGITALDPATGSIIWSSRFNAGTLLDPLVHDDVLLVSDSEFGLYVVAATNGELLQKVNQYEGFFARPSAFAGYLMIMGNSGTLIAMSIL